MFGSFYDFSTNDPSIHLVMSQLSTTKTFEIIHARTSKLAFNDLSDVFFFFLRTA